MENDRPARVGIGFATGRKSFRKVLRAYLYNWRESTGNDPDAASLNLFVAYDLKYARTRAADYTQLAPDLLHLLDETRFIGRQQMREEIADLSDRGIVTLEEANLVFGHGYAAMRNILLYSAMRRGMDCLIFLDDDEYPLAVTRTRATAIWSGQPVLAEHLKCIRDADITNGYHCGYISPIPSIDFSGALSEDLFRQFIEAISNEVVNWETVRTVMKNGGVTYADTRILTSDQCEEVPETNHARFITGANLCINLTDPSRVFPFYNPPNARGEDTFLGTCLSERRVLHIPIYAFHDGFSTYNHLLDGVLPTRLQSIQPTSETVRARFLRACLGWIRYKPLLLYITQPDAYAEKIVEIRAQLDATLPAVCASFDCDDFMKIRAELDAYDAHVERHYAQFLETRRIWARIVRSLDARHRH